MNAALPAALLILPLLAAAPASAACSIDVAVENRGTGALEIRPEAFDSGVHLLEGAGATGGPGGFGSWDAPTVLEPGETVVHPHAAPAGSTCGEERRFQMAYRCLDRDVRGITFATHPRDDGEPGRVTIPLTRCE